jgi:hypothetical protein
MWSMGSIYDDFLSIIWNLISIPDFTSIYFQSSESFAFRDIIMRIGSLHFCAMEVSSVKVLFHEYARTPMKPGSQDSNFFPWALISNVRDE